MDLATEENPHSSVLFDCYRVALDFGLPVAEKAIENLLACSASFSTESTGLAQQIKPR